MNKREFMHLMMTKVYVQLMLCDEKSDREIIDYLNSRYGFSDNYELMAEIDKIRDYARKKLQIRFAGNYI